MISRLHSADEDAVSWLTNALGEGTLETLHNVLYKFKIYLLTYLVTSPHAYEKKTTE